MTHDDISNLYVCVSFYVESNDDDHLDNIPIAELKKG